MRRFLPYLQLVRLPNVFTAMSDIVLAALAVGAFPDRWILFVLLLLASSCFYCSGMVWNDIFDRDQDAQERPFRPIPSKKVPLTTAIFLALVLMVIGICLAIVVSWQQRHFLPLSTSIVLCFAILLYDAWLKRTWTGPLGMGWCRYLNIQLGLTLSAGVWLAPSGFLVCAVIGLYIVGVTWFARTEARESQRWQLILAFVVMIMTVMIAIGLPILIPVERDAEWNRPVSSAIQWGFFLFPYALIGFLIYISQAIIPAINRPVPERVQPAVKRCVLGLVILDAILAMAFVGPLGLLLALLLVPSMWLGKRIYST